LNINDTAFTDEKNKTQNTLNIPIKENTLGELMSIIDTDNRFIYIGAETTPPCNGKVYWNIVKTVYPIKKEHLDFLKNTMKFTAPGLEITGNNREV